MANTNDPIDDLESAEHQNAQDLQGVVGEHAVASQQAGYAQTIAANNAAKPAPVPKSKWVSALPEDTQKAVANQVDQMSETPGAIWSGAVHGIAELATSINTLASLDSPQTIWEALSSHSSDPNMRDAAARNAQRTQDINDSIRAGADAITPDINGGSGKLIKGTLQFLTNFLPVSRVAKVASIVSTPVRIGATAVVGGIANASAFDPNGGHLNDFLNSVPALRNPVTSFLKTNPGDSAALGALKNGIEGALGSAVGDVALEGLTHAITGIRAMSSIANTAKTVAEAPSTVIAHDQPNVVSTTRGYTKTMMPASELPEGLHPKDGTEFPDNATSFVAHDSTTGEALAHVTTVPSGGQMRAIRMDTIASARGNGIARDLLGDAIDHAHANDMPFVSDTQMSTGAQKVYESVPGREITANKNFDVANDPTDGAVNVSSNGRPLYEAPVPKTKPYEPPTVNNQDTTHPTAPEQPKVVPPSPGQQNNTFSYKEGDARKTNSGFPQPPGTPTDKLFSNFANVPRPPHMTDEAWAAKEDSFRASMLDRTQRTDGLEKANAPVTSVHPFEGNIQAEVTAATKGSKDGMVTRVDLKDGSTLVGSARMEGGHIDSIAIDKAYAGNQYGEKLLGWLKDNKLANVESVADRSPGFVAIQKKVLSDTAAKVAPAETASAPKAAPEAPSGPQVFNPETYATNAIKVAPDKLEAFMQQLHEGKYSNITQMLDDTHNMIPFAQLHEGANLQGLFNAVTDHFGDAIRAASGPVHVSDEVVGQFAQDIGGNVNDLQRTFTNLTENGGLAPHIMAGEYMQVASGRQLQDLLETAHSLNRDTDAGKAALLAVNDQMEVHAAIVGMVRQNKSEVARALRILQVSKASTSVQMTNLDDLVGTVLGPGALEKFQNDLRGAKDLASLNNAVDNMRNSGGFWAWMREIAQHGLISNIGTHAANLTGNIVSLFRSPLERFMAGTIGEVRGVMFPTAEHATIRSAIAHTEGMIQGLHDAFPMAVKSLSWMEEPTVSATGQAMRRAIQVNTDGMVGPKLTGAQALNVTGAVIRYPGRAMGAIDHFNTGAASQADLYARAYTQSAMEADTKGLRGDERDAFIQQRSQEIRTNPTTEMRDASIMQGNRQAFLETPQTALGGPVGKALSANPLVKLLVAPYFQRPMNMLRQSIVDYTALGIFNKSVRTSLGSSDGSFGGFLNGKTTQDTDLALARMTMGTGATLYGYNLASQGLNSGSGLGLKNTASLADIPKDSVMIGGRAWRYDRLDPIGVWLHIGADLHDIVNRFHDPNDPKGEADLATLIRIGVQTVGMASMDKSFMKSADGLMKALSEKNGLRADKLMQDLVATNVLKFVPFSGLLRGAANSVDPVERAAGGEGLAGVWDAAKRQLPYLSSDLPPARDVLGRPRLHREGNTAWFNPFGGAPPSQDHTDQELSKIAVAIKTPPRQLAGVALDAHQYDEVLTNATQTPMFPGNKNLADYMKDVVASPTWTDGNKNSDNGVALHSKITQEIIDHAYGTGGKLYMRDHPEFMQLKIAQAQQHASLFAPAQTATPPSAPVQPPQQ